MVYREGMRTFTVRAFDSFAEAERADNLYYLSLTPEQRLRIMCELCALRVLSHHVPCSPTGARLSSY